MIPINLAIHLSVEQRDPEIQDTVRAWFPRLAFGCMEDLLLGSRDWPPALVETAPPRDFAALVGFPTRVIFHLFPECPHNSVMRPVKVALMRRFACHFECRTLCDAAYFREDEAWTYDETFLCRGDRLFSAPYRWFEIGAVDQVAWQPLDDIPACRLDGTGHLVDRDRTVRMYERWRVRRPPPREPSALGSPSSPVEWEAEDDASESSTDAFASEMASEPSSIDPYLERLSQWEDGFGTTASKLLIASGTDLPAPGELDAADLHDKLWEVIHAMARLQIYLSRTNHLGDRELYTHLWTSILNQETMDLSGIDGAACHVDLLGSGSEEDIRMSLTYFDGAAERARWWRSWPEDVIPLHIDPPHDRDRLLPVAERL